MAETKLNQKEKELVALGAAISAGCQKCADSHFKNAFGQGAAREEVKKAVDDAICVINSAKAIMQRRAQTLMKGAVKEVSDRPSKGPDRISELVKVGAAAAANCTTSIEKHIEIAKSLGVSPREMRIAIGVAKAVRTKAGEFADEAIASGLTSEVEEDRTITTGCDETRSPRRSG